MRRYTYRPRLPRLPKVPNMSRRSYSYNNAGCKEIFLSWVSMIMWVLVFCVALMGFAIDEWVGVAFMLIVVGTHLIVAVVAKKREQVASDNKSIDVASSLREALHHEDIENAKETSHIISKDYFNQVEKVAGDVFADYEKILKLPNVENIVNTMGVQFIMNGKPMTDVKEKIRLLLWVDITRCYIGLGHLIDLDSKEGLGLLYLIALTKGCTYTSYSKIAVMKGVYQSEAEAVIKGVKAYIDTAPGIPEVFLLSRLLASNDTQLHHKFLVDIYRFASIAAKADNTVTEEEAEWLSSIMRLQNGGGREIVPDEDEEKIVANTVSQDSSNPKPATPKKPSATSAMKELKSLIGLESVKKEVETLSNFIKIQQTREAKGLKTSSVSYHCVFTGNPGTGKTTVARILAKIYKKLGVVSKGHLVETDRAGLVAEYVGQTAVKTNKIIDSALDGVLFIDEAYSLVSKSESDYGKEAIATLLKRMEDDRNRLIVILAGYTNEMKEFIDTNPGLQSRFNRYIEFPDYNENELLQIFMRSVEQYEYTMSNEAVEGLKNYLKMQVANKDKNFGNGRLVRNIFEKTLERQANRLAHEVNLTTEKLSRIEIEDLPLK